MQIAIVSDWFSEKMGYAENFLPKAMASLGHEVHLVTLKNLIGMVDKSGIALVTVPDGRIDTFEGHINFWSPESWEVFVKDLVGNGFDVETGILLGGGSNSMTNFATIKQNGATR